MRFKKVLRWDSQAKLFRVCRLMWEVGNIGHKLSLAVSPKLFRFRRDTCDVEFLLLGIRLHHVCSGGRYV